MPIAPPMYLAQATRPKPLPYGLLSVATVVTDDTAHWRAGVEGEGDACMRAHHAGDPCATPEQKIAESVVSTVAGDPFSVYVLSECAPVGGRWSDAEERAIRALERSEGVAVEEAFMEHVLAGGDAVNLYGNDDVFDLATGFAILEGWLASEYGGVGVIHAARAVAALAAKPIKAQHDGDMVTTFLGTPIAAGGGYDPSLGPDGTEAAPGTAWLYATGAVTLYRSEIDSFGPTLASSEDGSYRNEMSMLAERTYVPVVDCAIGAVQVSLCPCPPEEVTP